MLRTKTLTILFSLALATTSCAQLGSPLSSADSTVAVGPPPTAPPDEPAPTPTPTTTPSTTTSTIPVQDPAVERILAGYTTWTDPGLHSSDDRGLAADDWHDASGDAGREFVTCAPSALPVVVRELDEFPAFGFSGDDVLPGLVVDGSAAIDGDIRVLPLARSPFTLRSSLASANPTVLVASPNSGSIAEAVASLKRDADPRLGAIDVTSSDIIYSSSETHSFEQSSLDIGVSLRYRNRLVAAGLDADYRQEQSVERHTITVRMVQRQLTLSMVDDAIVHPGHFFDATVGAADVERLVGAGSIGAANPPMVIDRVTYGRLMYFTMSSTEVRSSQELSAAVEAVKGKYEGTATIDARQQEVINSSEISMVAYGGDQDLALGAIRTGDLGQFFGPANSTTAAPLAFTFATLGGAPVSLTESADVTQLTCQRTPAPYQFSIRIDEVQGKLKVLVEDTEVKVVKDGNTLFTRTDGTGNLQGGTLNDLLVPGENDIALRYTNLGCDNQFRVRVFAGSSLPNDLDDHLLRNIGHPSAGECFGDGDVTVRFTINTTTGVVG